MNKAKAKKMFEDAMSYSEENYAGQIEWAKGISPKTFKNLKSKKFLKQYCWVVYASGFKVSTIENLFPKLQKSFKDFEIDKLSRMRTLTAPLSVFNNERKANSFLKGSKMIAEEGFPGFKKRLKEQGLCVLEELPGIGEITQYHLAKNIGFIDEAKPDIWLIRAAEASNATVDELVSYLSEQYDLSRHVVDVILWQYGADKNLGL